MRIVIILPLVLALLAIPAFAQQPEAEAKGAPAGLLELLDAAESLEALDTVTIARDGEIIAERAFREASPTAPTNIKSASKTIVSALVGMAIDRGILEGVDQKIAPLLPDDLPASPDPRLDQVTIGNLLSMQAGLRPTSNDNYGRWIASRNWVRAALDQPFVAEPGGRMLYSTGSTHLLSAILTRTTGKPTLVLAREWLGALPGFAIADWQRDPQGIYLGGNQMAMSPRSLLAFGELYRRGGLASDGTRLLPQQWIDASWERRTHSDLSGHDYGYAWFATSAEGHEVRYAWGFGGQMLYIVPDLALTVVMTSDETSPSASTGYKQELDKLLTAIVAALSS